MHRLPRLARLLHDIASGMLHLHSQQPSPIIHRDIRCANILLHADGHAVLGDWGLSRSVKSEAGKKPGAESGDAKDENRSVWWEEEKTDGLETASISGYVSSAGSMTPWPW